MKKKLGLIFGVLGSGLFGFALFANRLGFDRENDWELGRVNLAVSGAFFILIGLFLAAWVLLEAFFEKNRGRIEQNSHRLSQWFLHQHLMGFLSSKLNALRAGWSRTAFVVWVQKRVKPMVAGFLAKAKNSRLVRYFRASRGRMSALAAVVLGIFVIVIYVWFISLGFWNEWPTTTTYYNKLAEAFWHGQTSLLLEPQPALLALADPYQVENRQGVPYLWDAVLFNGKFYLYWGPAPALFLTVIRFFHPGEIGDQIPGFCFILGHFLVSVLLLLKIHNTFFEELGWPALIPGILMAGLTNPLLWMLNRAAVYETAIAGGQFFLITGFYLAFLSLDSQKRVYWRLSLAGTSLALAMASRLSLAPAVFFLLVMICGYLLRKPLLTLTRKMISFVSLGIPFAAGVFGLGWYNKTRFGSWFEFGQRYQLTTMNQNALADQLMSWANIPINLYNYLFNPYTLNSTFPYIFAEWGSRFVLFPIHGSKYHFVAEPVSGILVSVPYVLFSIPAVLFLIREAGKALVSALKKQATPKSAHDQLLLWTLFSLIGMSALAFGPLLLFFADTMRYLADFVPSLVLLATLGCFISWKELHNNPKDKRWFTTLIVVLMLISVATSCLLAVSGLDNRMEKVNPATYYRLVEMFSFGIGK
jgi:hypothetical protein